MALKLNVPVKTTQLPAEAQKNLSVTVKADGVADLSQGRQVNMFPIPETLDVSVTSVAGTGAVDTVVYLFNQDVFQNVTNNGKGADSITYTYGDANIGKTYNQLIKTAGAGLGVKIYGFNIDFTDSEGNAAPSAITTAALKQVIADGNGGTIPINVKIQKAKRNTAQDRGLLTVIWETNFNALSQLAMLLPVGITCDISLFTTPDFQ